MKRLALTVLLACAAAGARGVPPAYLKNLDDLPKKLAACEKTIASPKATPLAVRQAKFEYERLQLFVCEDAEFESHRAAFLRLVTDRDALPVQDYVKFLYGPVAAYDRSVTEIPDIDALADAATKDADEAARWLYVSSRLNRIRKARLRPSLNLVKPLSDSERLPLLEEAERDPRLAEPHRLDIVLAKADCLKDLGREPEAERLLVAAGTTTNATELARVLPALAGLYVHQSKRYFDDPHLPTLRKAYAVYDRLLAVEDAKAKPSSAARAKTLLAKATAAATARDCTTMKRALADWKACQKPGKESPDGLLLLADARFYAGEYAAAADDYLSVPDKSLKLDHHVRCAEALFACGRRREAIPHVAFAAKRTGKYQRLHYQRVLDKLNVEFNSEGKEQ